MPTYICDENNKTFKDWLDNYKVKYKEIEERKAFLRRQVENLQKEFNDLWKDIFQKMQAEGLIPKDFKEEDYHSQLGGTEGARQLFIDKCESGIHNFFTNITTRF